jgi:hypothetical protein
LEGVGYAGPSWCGQDRCENTLVRNEFLCVTKNGPNGCDCEWTPRMEIAE